MNKIFQSICILMLMTFSCVGSIVDYTTIGGGSSTFTGSYSNLTGLPYTITLTNIDGTILLTSVVTNISGGSTNIVIALSVNISTNSPVPSQVNFNLGQLYTNTTGYPLLVIGNVTNSYAATAGSSMIALMTICPAAIGGWTNYEGKRTTASTVVETETNTISLVVPTNAPYCFTNFSVGTGDSSGVIGGQLIPLGFIGFGGSGGGSPYVLPGYVVTNNNVADFTEKGILTVSSRISIDSGQIFSDGSGNLTVGDSINTDSGQIFSDGGGNLTITENEQVQQTATDGITRSGQLQLFDLVTDMYAGIVQSNNVTVFTNAIAAKSFTGLSKLTNASGFLLPTNAPAASSSTNLLATDSSGNEVAVPWSGLPSGGGSTANIIQTNVTSGTVSSAVYLTNSLNSFTGNLTNTEEFAFGSTNNLIVATNSDGVIGTIFDVIGKGAIFKTNLMSTAAGTIPIYSLSTNGNFSLYQQSTNVGFKVIRASDGNTSFGWDNTESLNASMYNISSSLYIDANGFVINSGKTIRPQSASVTVITIMTNITVSGYASITNGVTSFVSNNVPSASLTIAGNATTFFTNMQSFSVLVGFVGTTITGVGICPTNGGVTSQFWWWPTSLTGGTVPCRSGASISFTNGVTAASAAWTPMP